MSTTTQAPPTTEISTTETTSTDAETTHTQPVTTADMWVCLVFFAVTNCHKNVLKISVKFLRQIILLLPSKTFCCFSFICLSIYRLSWEKKSYWRFFMKRSFWRALSWLCLALQNSAFLRDGSFCYFEVSELVHITECIATSVMFVKGVTRNLFRGILFVPCLFSASLLPSFFRWLFKFRSASGANAFLLYVARTPSVKQNLKLKEMCLFYILRDNFSEIFRHGCFNTQTTRVMGFDAGC